MEKKEDYTGTCLQGTLYAEYDELLGCFGEPHHRGGYKTDAEWGFVEDCVVFTIYNYKNGKNYCGKKGLSVEEITDWHIGGYSTLSEIVVNKILDEYRRCWGGILKKRIVKDYSK